MQCTEAALNKDFWHNLCAANTPLSRNIVAEIGKIIASYAINLRIEREQLREFVQQLTQALEKMAQENTSTTSIARHFERNVQDLEKFVAEQDTKLQKHDQQRALYMYNKEHTMMLARTVLRDLGVPARNDVDLNMVTVIQDVAHVVRQRTIDECEKEAIRTVTAAYARSPPTSPVSMTDSMFDDKDDNAKSHEPQTPARGQKRGPQRTSFLFEGAWVVNLAPVTPGGVIGGFFRGFGIRGVVPQKLTWEKSGAI